MVLEVKVILLLAAGVMGVSKMEGDDDDGHAVIVVIVAIVVIIVIVIIVIIFAIFTRCR